MTRIRFACITSLLLALPLLAQTGPAIDPPDPTSKDSVTLIVQQFDSCPPPPDVSRSGFDITVTIHYGLCLFPPSLITHRLELGKLPAGRYNTIIKVAGAPDPGTTFSFTVLDATGYVQVAQSVGPTAGGTSVVVTSYSYCSGTGCPSAPLPEITFGGIAATSVTVIGPQQWAALTPPHEPGPVEVKVAGSGGSASSYAFRYYDPAAEPSSKWFEKVLIPVIYNGAGALGSNWTTEASVRNDNGWPVEPWRPIEGTRSIPPVRPFRFGSGNAPSGAFVIIPHEAAAGLSFHAAVRNTTRADSEWATEIPVVRERDFSTGTIELLDLPSDPRYRITLRIYTLTPPSTTPKVALAGVYSMDDDGQDLKRYTVTLGGTTECNGTTACFDQPASGTISGIGTGLVYPRLGIRIPPVGVPMWAFATITNNETQHVTVVSPH